MPREITKTIYTFQELLDLHNDGKATNQAMERARHWLQEAQTDHEWYDAVYDIWKQALSQIGFIDAEISFRGFWSQGDGASFTAGIDLEKLADFLASEIEPKDCIEGEPEDFRPWLVHKCDGKPTRTAYRRLRTLGDFCYPCQVERIQGLYVHEKTCRICIELNCGTHYDRGERVGRLLSDFEVAAEVLRVCLSKAIYNDLEAEYEYLTGDEALKELADSNDYTFTIHGEREG